MELWTKICILALCSLWYFSAISPPLCLNGADLLTESFQARHSFSVITTAFHFMGWSGQPYLLISFFAIQAFAWGGILIFDLYFTGHVFFTGVKLLPPFSESISFLGVPLILLIAFVSPAYWAMSLSNIIFNTTASPPYTNLILDTSEVVQETEEEENSQATSSKSNNSKSKKKKEKDSNSSKTADQKAIDEQLKDFVSENTPKKFLFQQKSSKAVVPFDISLERARYATIDTLFFLPFICMFDFFIQDGDILAYPNAPIKIFGVPSARLSGYIVVPFCAFLLYRHLEASTLPTLTYFLSGVSELRTLKTQMVILTLLAYGSQVYWISTLLISSKKPLALLFPQVLPLFLASLRFIFSFLDGSETPIPLTEDLGKTKET